MELRMMHAVSSIRARIHASSRRSDLAAGARDRTVLLAAYSQPHALGTRPRPGARARIVGFTDPTCHSFSQPVRTHAIVSTALELPGEHDAPPHSIVQSAPAAHTTWHDEPWLQRSVHAEPAEHVAVQSPEGQSCSHVPVSHA